MTALPDPDVCPDLYADVPLKRFIAFWIDTVVILLISVVLIPLTALIALLFFPVTLAFVTFVYRFLFIASWSATPGMRLMSIQFRDRHDRMFDAGLAMLHTVGFMVSFALPVLQMFSALSMATSPRGQGVTDLMLGTTALNNRRAL